jgi:hypothetical protein
MVLEVGRYVKVSKVVFWVLDALNLLLVGPTQSGSAWQLRFIREAQFVSRPFAL